MSEQDYWSENLLEASLGYVTFPIGDRRVQTGREYARHREQYRDGQGGEDLGRKVYVFTLVLPLYRGVDWDGPVPLYPDTYEQLLAIIESPELRGEVEYVDPEYGLLSAKILDYDIHTPATDRNGVNMTITVEERGYDGSVLENLRRPRIATEADALGYASAVDIEVSYIDDPDKPAFSLTQAWRSFQGLLDQGALAADVVAAYLDELYFVAEKFVQFSFRDEVERTSIFNSVVDLLGAAEDVADERQRNQNAGTRLLEIVLPAEMSAYDIASAYFGDAGRAEEVISQNPTGNPMAYPRGATVRLNADARAPAPRAA